MTSHDFEVQLRLDTGITEADYVDKPLLDLGTVILLPFAMLDLCAPESQNYGTVVLTNPQDLSFLPLNPTGVSSLILHWTLARRQSTHICEFGLS